MTLPPLTAQKFGIYGIQNSGKSHFSKFYVVNKLFPGRSWVATPLPYEWKDPSIKCFYTETRTIDDIERICAAAKKKAMQGKLKLLLIDEADMWFKHNFDETPAFRELVLQHRHFSENPGKIPGLALGLITRRPQDIPHHFVGSSHASFVFKIEDAYAIKAFESLHPSMPQLINSLGFTKHDFVVKEIGKTPYVHQPI